MKRRRRAATITALLFLAGCAARYEVVPIASAVTISQEWTEIQPAQPLYWTKPVEEIDFHIDSAYRRDLKADILGADGKPWAPDVQVTASDGKTYPVYDHGFWGDDMFFSPDKLPDSVAVVAIRIRSKFPLRISNVRWTGYNPVDVKR